jgi:hypothetical protein
MAAKTNMIRKQHACLALEDEESCETSAMEDDRRLVILELVRLGGVLVQELLLVEEDIMIMAIDDSLSFVTADGCLFSVKSSNTAFRLQNDDPRSLKLFSVRRPSSKVQQHVSCVVDVLTREEETTKKNSKRDS